MCIIVDTNKINSFFTNPSDSVSAPIHKWLKRGAGTVIYSTGGKFANELGGKALQALAVYDRAGFARKVSADSFQQDESELMPKIRSNDAHVLALARQSGARLLYTDDSDLTQDFKDKQFVDRPRGSVYSKSSHDHLLNEQVCKLGQRRQNPR